MARAVEWLAPALGATCSSRFAADSKVALEQMEAAGAVQLGWAFADTKSTNPHLRRRQLPWIERPGVKPA